MCNIGGRDGHLARFERVRRAHARRHDELRQPHHARTLWGGERSGGGGVQ